jgi:nitroreductase
MSALGNLENHDPRAERGVTAPESTSAVPVGENAPILEVMSTLRAMRRLKPDPVPDELLERLVQAASWAPSAGNEQAYQFVVVTDREVIARLAGLWGRSVDAYLRSLGRVTAATQDGRVVRAARYQRDHFHETPAVIVPCYPSFRMNPRTTARMLRSFSAGEAARLIARGPRMNVIAEASSVYPGVQNLLLAARALGLGAVLTIWHLMLEQEWKRELGIPKGINTLAVIPVGWPRGRFGPVTRRPAAELIHRDRW